MADDQLTLQAQRFAQYLVHADPTPHAIQLYRQALAQKVPLDAKDTRLLALVDRHPSLLGLVDAALPLLKPYSEVRRRLYLMLAILEASPEYYQSFVPLERPPLYFLVVGLACVRAVCKTILGMLLVVALGAKRS
ncbi:MAG: hypothetical protein JWN38_721 [Candidatus Saccharibacteria bacterium]|nr:hypothetical protein [Candidatus Saccharibacteria bacterium]